MAVMILTDSAARADDDPRQIVIPAEPAAIEQHAADELAGFLQKITGRTYPIVSEDRADRDTRSIVVGRTNENLEAHDPANWPTDTIHIGYGDGDIAILGQGSQGTLFGVYEFLRDQGCRWYMPDHIDAELVPRRARLLLDGKPKHHTPSFSQRGWHGPLISPGAWTAHYRDWAVRNGLNTPALGGDIAGYGPERGNGRLIRPGHTIPTLIPSGDQDATSRIFSAHPDWYPLVKGERVSKYKDGRAVQVCASNPEVVQEVARRVIEYFRLNPDCVQFSVSQADEPSYWCECANCKAMDGPDSVWQHNDPLDAYGLRSKVGPGPMSTRTVKFVNQVARIAGEACPGKLISFYAYASTVAPPRDKELRLEPNVIVEFAYGDGWCLSHSEDDSSCTINDTMKQWLHGWASRGNPVVFYDYPPNGSRFDIPAGFTTRYRSLIAFTKREGVVGWSGEGQCTWAGSALWQNLKARLVWNIETDPDALVAEFCRDMYGTASEPMREFYQEMERVLGALPGHVVYGNWAMELTEPAIARLSRLISDAEDKADSQPVRRRVAMMRVALSALELARMRERIASGDRDETLARFDNVRSETLELIEKYSLPVGDTWRDSLSKDRAAP